MEITGFMKVWEQKKEDEEENEKKRREQIMKAVVELLTNKGFNQTTMDKIADRTEFSKGSLYFYFGDKADLYRAFRREALQMIREESLNILQEDEPGGVLVKKMAKNFLGFVEKFPVYTMAVSPQNEHLPHGEIKETEKELHKLITRALQIGIQDGNLETNTNPKILAI